MRSFGKISLYLILISVTGLLLALQLKEKKNVVKHAAIENRTAVKFEQVLNEKSKKAKEFCTINGFNQQYCFLIDMHLPSGFKRFFIYDFKGDSVFKSGLVAHGRCNQNWREGRKYGNIVGCGCTSLGKYKIGSQYVGRFGKAFKLHGLEKTNDKAFERFVVLHSYSEVPDSISAQEICQSDGCPMLSKSFLENVAGHISNSSKPILLWIYDADFGD